MKNNTFYIDKVAELFPAVERTCRPVIAFFKQDGIEFAVSGFVIGEKYIIDAGTQKVYEKSASYLVNYLDEDSDE